MLLFLVSFVAGLLTVLAPCILPLLPVIVGGSLGATGETAGSRRVFVIVGALAVSVIAFTFLLKVSTALIGIPQSVWSWISGGIVIAFGLTLLFPGLWERIPYLSRLSASANRTVGAGHQRKSVLGDVIIGAALGPVFTTCSPTYFIVLATVLSVNFALGLVYLLAYTAGLSLALIAIGLVGQQLADRLGVIADPYSTFKRALGIVFIAVGVIISTGLDKTLQIRLLDAGYFDVTWIEQWLLRSDEMRSPLPAVREVIEDETMRIAKKEALLLRRAPEIVSPAGFINSGPITISKFRGKKVVLLEIWTYSCINCQRTIPYLNAWHTAYEDDGLVIIGIHTPEFAFEKEIENVRWAVEQFGIKYPTVLDNEYATWRELGNNYWPRKYLIDIDGFIVYDHIGEGAYDETEIAIQQALMERAVLLGSEVNTSRTVADRIPGDRQFRHSPEIYFGAWRNDRLGNGVPRQTGARTFVLPAIRERDRVYLEGDWETRDEFARASSGAKIRMQYTGREVFMVASGDAVVKVRRDSEERTVTVSPHRLYELVRSQGSETHDLQLEIVEGTLDIYTFTFG
jgi:cytochrome c biogenesis protein CcdA/thiol-disulfide isomerase/thioredoxin